MLLRSHSTFEIVTNENFNDARYLSANPDVKKAGVSAWLHFDKVGRYEKRRQFASDTRDHREKYRRFRHTLASPYGDELVREFPIFTGSEHYSTESYTTQSANPTHYMFEREILLNTDKIFLDIGCGIRERTFDNCLYLEVYESNSADLVVDPSCVYPFKDSVFDGIGCFAVLEHTRKPWVVASEMYRILKPGGKIYVDWPFLQPVHGYPSHYFNATREGLRTILEDIGFEINLCETQENQTVSYTISWILSEFVCQLKNDDLRADFEAMTIKDIISWNPSDERWLKFVRELDDTAIEELACGNFVLAGKPLK